MHNDTVFDLTDAVAGVSASDVPQMVRIRQHYPRPIETDVGAAVHRELADVLDHSLAGKRIAITGSSRGIANLDTVIRACVDALKAVGAQPFVVPGMGSHGGATAEGQINVLAETNRVTEESVGCPIHSSMDVVQVGTTASGFPVYQDRNAIEADGVLLVNRVKPHTGFTERVESGLCKMLVIGLGKLAGASRIHQQSRFLGMGRLILDASKIIIEGGAPHLIGGVALVENAFKETAMVRGTRITTHDDLLDFESALLKDAWKLLPTLPFADIDALVVNEIGKNISGSGMDTNVIGIKPGMTKPSIGAIYVRGLTEETHGNATGIGYADLTLRHVIDEIDLNSTYMNALSAKRPAVAKIPMAMENDLNALKFLLNFRREESPDSLRMAWIKNTSALGEMWCTRALLDSVAGHDGFEITDEMFEPAFDSDGMVQGLTV